MEAVRNIFQHGVHSCDYRRHVPNRGAEAMFLRQQGDCGQVASLFVAMCRAAGIPARVVVGTLLGPSPSPHAWAEFWWDKTGWLPVDASVAQGLASGRVQPPSVGNAAQWLAPGRFFAAPLTGIHFAFSLGLDVLLCGYGPTVRPLPLPALAALRVKAAGRRVLWGYKAPGGAAPRLQPAYPRGSRGRGAASLVCCSQSGEWASTAASTVTKRLRARRALQQYFLLTAVVILAAGWAVGGPWASNAAPVLIVLLALQRADLLHWSWLR